MTQASLMGTINKIQDDFSKLPEDQDLARFIIGNCLDVIQGYSEWVNGLKTELLKLISLNDKQASKIREMTKPESPLILPE